MMPVRQEKAEQEKKYQETTFKVLDIFPPPGEGADPEPFLRAAADIVYQAFLEYEHMSQKQG
jgi:hypothetical protein